MYIQFVCAYVSLIVLSVSMCIPMSLTWPCPPLHWRPALPGQTLHCSSLPHPHRLSCGWTQGTACRWIQSPPRAHTPRWPRPGFPLQMTFPMSTMSVSDRLIKCQNNVNVWTCIPLNKGFFTILNQIKSLSVFYKLYIDYLQPIKIKYAKLHKLDKFVFLDTQ